MSATPQGVEESIHSRLMEVIAPEPEQEIVTPEATEELEATDKLEAPEELETAQVEGEEVSVEAEPSEIEAQEQEPSDVQEIELSHIAEYLGATEDQFTVNDGELMVKTKIEIGRASCRERV